jgi:hypothetical protein
MKFQGAPIKGKKGVVGKMDKWMDSF